MFYGSLQCLFVCVCVCFMSMGFMPEINSCYAMLCYAMLCYAIYTIVTTTSVMTVASLPAQPRLTSSPVELSSSPAVVHVDAQEFS